MMKSFYAVFTWLLCAFCLLTTPLFVNAQTTYYSYQSGNFSGTSGIWTTDPTGATLVGDPGATGPAANSNLVILAPQSIVWNTVTSLGTVTINAGATFDIQSRTGLTITTLSGQGTFRQSSVTLPTITNNNIVGASGGTWEYYNMGATTTLPTTIAQYYNLALSSSDNTAKTMTMGNAGAGTSLRVLNNFTIQQTAGTGSITFQVNDATANQRNIRVDGSLTVSAVTTGNATITVGTGTPANPHQLYIFGDLINKSGIIRFFDNTTGTGATLTPANYTSGAVYTTAAYNAAVNVWFRGSGSRLVCNGQTDFYRIRVNMASNTATWRVFANASGNWRIFGPNNTGASVFSPADTAKAFFPYRGVVRLGNNADIPSLTEANGDFHILRNVTLWVDSATVSVTRSLVPANVFRALDIWGTLQVSAGSITADDAVNANTAIVFGDSTGARPTINISGGAVTSTSFFLDGGAASSFCTFQMSGGTFTLNRNAGFGTGALFKLNSTNTAFLMSGGTINLNAVGTGTPNIIDVQTSSSNASITGGSLNVNLPNGTTATFNSSVTLPTLTLSNSSGVPTNTVILRNSTTATAKTFLGATIGTNCTFDFNTTTLADLVISSGNFTVNGTYTAANNAANTTSLTGSGNQTWAASGTINNLRNVTFSGGGTKTLSFAPNINGDLTIGTGTTLADGGNIISIITTAGNAVTNNGAHTGTGEIRFGAADALAYSIGGTGTFQNVTVNTTNATGVSLTSNITINGNLRLGSTTARLACGTFSLTLGSAANVYDALTGTTTAGLAAAKMITTTGGSSDGGVTRAFTTGSASFTYPIGTGTNYTPVTLGFGTPSAGAPSYRVVSVNAAHPTATANVVNYYWRVTMTGTAFTGGTVTNTFQYPNTIGTTGTPTTARYYNGGAGWQSGTGQSLAGNPRTLNFSNAAQIPTGATTFEYTAGDGTNPPTTLTTYVSCATTMNWTNGSWQVNGGPCTGAQTPTATSVVTISSGNTVTLTGASACAQLTITGTLDVGAQTLTASTGTGTGTMRINNTVFPAGDYGSFLSASGGTVEYYRTANTTLPATPTSYNNLVLTQTTAANNITTPNISNFRILGNLSASASNAGIIRINNGGTTDSTVVKGNLTVNAGIFRFRTNNANDRTLNIDGTLTVASGATFEVENAGASTHTIWLGGSLVNNGTLTLINGTAVGNLYFAGAANATISGTSTAATFNNITVDKGNSVTPVLDVTLGGTATFLTDQWLTLTNGTFRWSRTTNLTLLTSANNFSIPSTAKLSLNSSATLNVTTAASSASDLLLDGVLEITSAGTGTINVGSSANNNNNDIEYGTSGSATISIAAGTLYVNGQVRRNTTVTAGVLQYSQSAGTVQVGGRAAQNTRGVFEIANNSGSSFTMSNGTLWLQRPAGGTTFADLYLQPASNSVTGGTVQLGDGTVGAQTITMDCTSPLFNLQCFRNGAAGVQTIRPQNNDVTLNGALTIDDNTIFDLNTNARSVSIGTNLIVGGGTSGQFLGQNTGTTLTFASASAGAVTLNAGNTTNINNLTVNKTGATLTVNNALTVNNSFNLTAGTVSHGAVNINVLGTVTNNGTFTSTAGSGFVVVGGTTGALTAYTVAGSGTYGSLRLGGTAATVTVTASGSNTITGQLDLSQGATSRILALGANNLMLGASATVNGTVGVLRMITTNGLVSAGGVSKVFNTGSQTFTYPVGVSLYTPYAVTTLNVTAGGTLTIIPVNSVHPTAVTSGTDRYLNYYWRATASGGLAIGTAAGNFNVNRSTVTITGSTGTQVGKALNASNPTGWLVSNDATTNADPAYTWSLASSVAAFPASGNSFDYSLGTTVTLPTTLNTFTSSASGNFDDAATWGTASPPTPGQSVTIGTGTTVTTRANSIVAAALNAGGTGYTANDLLTVTGGGGTAGRIRVLSVISGAVSTFRIEVGGTGYATTTGAAVSGGTGTGATFNITTQLGVTPFSTALNGTGILSVGTTLGHNLGAITGTGTISASTGTLPGGNYTSFVTTSGGTINYATSGSAITMSNAATSTYNNLSITGNNTVNLPSGGITVNGLLSTGGTATLANPSGVTVTLLGNLTQGGTAITDASGTFAFSGTSAQTITGATTLNNLSLNNSAGLTLSGTGPTTVNGVLTLTSGNLTSVTGNTLTLGTSASVSGGSASSFVIGPMVKTIAGSGSFAFPLGASGQYRATTVANTSASDTWTAQYFAVNPNSAGFNPTTKAATFASISSFEYWDISRAGATSATLTLQWNTGSYTGGGVGTVSDMRIARWSGSQWDVPPGSGGTSTAGTATAGSVTLTNITNFSPFTLGSTSGSTLPVRWIYFTAKRQDAGVLLNWATASELNNDRFEVQRSADGQSFAKIGAVLGNGTTSTVSNYAYLDGDAPATGKLYYRLRQVDYDGTDEYSVIAEVGEGTGSRNNWVAYPNPFEGRDLQLVTTDETLALNTPITYRLMNVSGTEVAARRTTLSGLNTDVRDLAADLRPGLYVLLVQTPNGYSSIRIVKR
jgi:hypothetical protein